MLYAGKFVPSSDNTKFVIYTQEKYDNRAYIIEKEISSYMKGLQSELIQILDFEHTFQM